MKKIALGVTAVAALGLAACGSSTHSSESATANTATATHATSPPPLRLNAPRDRTVTGNSFKLRGTATADAEVTVNDEYVPSYHGHWSKKVRLDHGDNYFTVSVRKGGQTPVDADVTITRKWTAAEREAQRQAQEAKREARRRAEAARRAALEAKRAAQESNYKGRAVTIPYNALNKDADAQAGKIVTYTGKIFQIQEDSEAGGGIMLVSVTDEGYGVWDDHIWVNYRGHVSQNEGDSITFWGKVNGSKSYDTQIGGTTYVPEVTAKYVG